MPAAQPAPHPSRYRCNVCGGPLTVHEEVRGGTCARSSCRRTALADAIARRRERDAAILRQRISEIRAGVLARLPPADAEAARIAVVPAAQREIVPVEPRRRRELRRHLLEVLAAAAREEEAGAPPPGEEDRPGAPQFEQEPAALLAGCGTCRGQCCRFGAAHHAFLDVRTIRRYLAHRPHLRPRDVVRAYLSKVPHLAAQGSCVFHGAQGCALPRPMRAAICNEYRCGGLNEIARLTGAADARKVLIVATTETEVVRWRVHECDGGPA